MTEAKEYQEHPVKAVQFDGRLKTASKIINWILENGGNASWQCHDICTGGSDEHILRVDRDGKTDTVPVGCWVVSHSSGVFTIVDPTDFHKRYSLTDRQRKADADKVRAENEQAEKDRIAKTFGIDKANIIAHRDIRHDTFAPIDAGGIDWGEEAQKMPITVQHRPVETRAEPKTGTLDSGELFDRFVAAAVEEALAKRGKK